MLWFSPSLNRQAEKHGQVWGRKLMHASKSTSCLKLPAGASLLKGTCLPISSLSQRLLSKRRTLMLSATTLKSFPGGLLTFFFSTRKAFPSLCSKQSQRRKLPLSAKSRLANTPVPRTAVLSFSQTAISITSGILNVAIPISYHRFQLPIPLPATKKL